MLEKGHHITGHLTRPRRKSCQLKPRSDGILNGLTDEQQIKLNEWLLSNKLDYREIKQLIQEQFKIEVSVNLISNYYRKHVHAYLIERRRRNLELASNQNKDIKEHPGNFATAMIDALHQRTLNAANDRKVPVKELKAYHDMIRDWKKHQLEEGKLNVKLRHIAMLEKREREARAAMQDSRLSAAQQAERLREIFKT
jgi:hypothetical protein